MSARLFRIMSLTGGAVLALTAHGGGGPKFRKPVPPGVVELINQGIGSLVELKDGTLLSNNGRRSTDGGFIWSKPQSFGEGVGGHLVTLDSGALAITRGGPGLVGWWRPCELRVSEDEGKTWSDVRKAELLGGPYHDTMIQLESGRLLWATRVCFANDAHPNYDYKTVSSYGTWKGRRMQVAGHYHYPEIDIASVGRSDDLGKTWKIGVPGATSAPRAYTSAILMGWFDGKGEPNGEAGITACDEPNLAETKNGRVLFMARSTVGRLVYSYSDDGGEHWSLVRPTELPSSYSPCRLRRIPKTGDLLCVWNQVSREEIRRGYRRGRLSAAISTDNGVSWKDFRTLEVSEGLEDMEQVLPEEPITPVSAARDVGELPDGFAVFDYPNVCFAGDRVYVMYSRAWVRPLDRPKQSDPNAERIVTKLEVQATWKSESVLRIYPLKWFVQ